MARDAAFRLPRAHARPQRPGTCGISRARAGQRGQNVRTPPHNPSRIACANQPGPRHDGPRLARRPDPRRSQLAQPVPEMILTAVESPMDEAHHWSSAATSYEEEFIDPY